MINKKILKVVGITLGITMISSVAFAGSNITAAITNFKLYLNGTKVDKEIVVVNNSSYLPVRAISEALGLKVNWDEKTTTISLEGNANGNEAVLKETLSLAQKEKADLQKQVTDLNSTVTTLTSENTALKSQLAGYKGEVPTGEGEMVIPNITLGECVEQFKNNWNAQTPFKVKSKTFTDNVLGFKFLNTRNTLIYDSMVDSYDRYQGETHFLVNNTDYKYKKLTFSYANDVLNSNNECGMYARVKDIKGIREVISVDGVCTSGSSVTKNNDGIYTVTIDITGCESIGIHFLAAKTTSPSFALVFPFYAK
jgi:hypothetical protein